MGNAPDAAGLASAGRTAFTALLYPVVGVYWLTAVVRVKRRKPGSPVCANNNHWSKNQQLSALSTFRQRHARQNASWRGELQLGRDVLFAPGAERHLTSAIRAANCCWPRILACGSVPGAGKNSGLQNH